MSESLHLYIHLDDLSKESSTAGAGAEKKSSESDPKVLQSAAKKIVSYAAVKSTATKLWDGYVGQVELSTGASEYEARLSAGTSVAKQAWGAAEMIIGGAIFGGVAGFALGVVGVGVQAMNWGINYAISADRLQKEKTLEDISIGMKNLRAGTLGRRSREQ